MNLNATLIIQSLVLIFLGWVTMKFIWPPLIVAIETRQKKIAEGLAASERGEKELAAAKSNATDILKDARAQANKIVEQANRRSSEVIEEARGAAIAEGERLIANARQEVAISSGRAREQLNKEVAALVVAGTSKLLGREVDAKTHADLLNQLALEIERT